MMKPVERRNQRISCSRMELNEGTGGRGRADGVATSRGSKISEFGLFKRLIYAMEDRELGPEIVDSCLMNYAKKTSLKIQPETKASDIFFFLVPCAIRE